jgi:hypothetical protein
MPENVRQCQTCEFCVVFETKDRKFGTSRQHGVCHRYPPMPPLPTLSNSSSWPTVDPAEWCGEYKPKAGIANNP